jgi:peptidoglycan/LPS O-acetylase OafA/YrhL
MTLCRTRSGAEFIVSRFSRLYPAYWLAVLLTAAVVNAWGPAQAQRSPMEILANLTMLQEFIHVPHVDGVYWTLTCELMFYAWMFLLYKLGWLANANRVVACWLAIATLSLLCTKIFGYFPWKLTRFMLLQYAYLFAAGILFYLVYTRQATKLSYALLGLCVVNAALVHGFGIPLLFICSFFSIFLLIALGKAEFLNLRPLTFLGAISYSLYLLHENMGYLTLKLLNDQGINPDLAVFINVLLAIGVATLATFLVERPAMNAIRRAYRTRLARRVQTARA